jgi:hypothetical protein
MQCMHQALWWDQRVASLLLHHWQQLFDMIDTDVPKPLMRELYRNCRTGSYHNTIRWGGAITDVSPALVLAGISAL